MPSLNYYWVPLLVRNGIVLELNQTQNAVVKNVSWCEKIGLDIHSERSLSPDSDIRFVPGGPWLLQRLRHVCGHAVPLLL